MVLKVFVCLLKNPELPKNTLNWMLVLPLPTIHKAKNWIDLHISFDEYFVNQIETNTCHDYEFSPGIFDETYFQYKKVL